MIRFVLAILVLVLAIASPATAQIEPLDDEPGAEAPGLGDIVPRPDAGPKPEDAGDRGGWAQLLLGMAILAGGAVFVLRLARLANGGDRVGSNPTGVVEPSRREHRTQGGPGGGRQARND